MKLKILIFYIVFILIACSTDKNPVDTVSSEYDVYIRPTGEVEEDYLEFSFKNITNDTLYYNGFSKSLPFYSAQVQNDSGWVSYIHWRCGTGLQLIEFVPSETIKTNVSLPPTDLPWRVGLSVRKEPDGEDYSSWSAIQN